MKFRAILNDKYDLEEIAQRKQSARPHHKTLIYFAVVWAVLNILAIIYITKKVIIYIFGTIRRIGILQEKLRRERLVKAVFGITSIIPLLNRTITI